MYTPKSKFSKRHFIDKPSNELVKVKLTEPQRFEINLMIDGEDKNGIQSTLIPKKKTNFAIQRKQK